MKKHKMLAEFIALKETEHGAIDIMASIKLMQDISKLAKKHGFEAYAKGYPKEVIDYVPTGKTYQIKTVEDIAKLTADQFEMFIDDLRSFCRTMHAVDAIHAMGMKTECEPGMTWIDSGKHETTIETTLKFSNKI